jgi:hypothetical protein
VNGQVEVIGSGQSEQPLSGIVLPTHLRCASHTLTLIGATDASKALKNPAAFSVLIMHACCYGQMFCLMEYVQKSAEIIKEICGCDLITPCTKRCKSLYDSVKKILEKLECLYRHWRVHEITLFQGC